MKHRKMHHRHDNLSPALDAAGERLAQVLLSSVDNIDANTLQRLRAAREQAVEQHRLTLVHAAQTGLSLAGHSGRGHTGDDGAHASWWQRFSGVGMLITLLLGLWMIDAMQSEKTMQDFAEIDRVLLTDDLPPAAYLDPGFKRFLKLSFPGQRP